MKPTGNWAKLMPTLVFERVRKEGEGLEVSGLSFVIGCAAGGS